MEKIQFMTSLLTFYMKGEINHNGNFINIKIPNTFLRFIPLGSRSKQIMVNQVASTDSSFKVFAKDIIVGLIELFVGIALLGAGNLWGILLLLIGAGTIISGFQTSITLNLSSGEMFYIFFLVFEKDKAAQAINMINSVISARMDDTNTRMVTENQTERIVDAIGKIGK
ncbi:MAG: hypothetical protein NC203_11255 [Firmicutes bacterium]|nr:hypothetical protein [[Eubacterium] siraeum]MCM1488932.1 hypothetical protein [Bacillota bacterium]